MWWRWSPCKRKPSTIQKGGGRDGQPWQRDMERRHWMSAILMLSIKNLELLNEGAGVLPRGRHRALKKTWRFQSLSHLTSAFRWFGSC